MVDRAQSAPAMNQLLEVAQVQCPELKEAKEAQTTPYPAMITISSRNSKLIELQAHTKVYLRL